MTAIENMESTIAPNVVTIKTAGKIIDSMATTSFRRFASQSSTRSTCPLRPRLPALHRDQVHGMRAIAPNNPNKAANGCSQNSRVGFMTALLAEMRPLCPWVLRLPFSYETPIKLP